MLRDKAGSRGILNPRGGEARFELARYKPAADLAMLVDSHWTVRWDLRGQPSYEQEVLPWPCVNVAFGTHRPGVHGPTTKRFVAHLEGVGWVCGTKFRAGGFRPFLEFSVSELANRVVTIASLLGEVPPHGKTDAECVAALETLLRSRKPEPDAESLRASRIVELAQSDTSLTSAEGLAERANVPLRSLQRLFRNYVGVSPKWVIQRFRIHEAAERLANGSAGSALAHDCGYFDQAHFIRDFKAQIGKTPGEYAALCRATEGRSQKTA